MTQRLILSGSGYTILVDDLRAAFKAVRPRAVGIASAFVSAQGIDLIDSLLSDETRQVRIIAGTSLEFTHPTALTAAQELDWKVKLGHTNSGIFHPKLIIGGASFSADGSIREPSLLFIGSANVTGPALKKNVECGVLFLQDNMPPESALVFKQLWQNAQKLTPNALSKYAAAFTKRNRSRAVKDIEEFGVTDTKNIKKITPKSIRTHTIPPRQALRYEDADTVWVGLETSTGEYDFQPEFPRIVGDMVLRMIRERGIRQRRHGSGQRQRLVTKISVLCSDGKIRDMTFTFYQHNSMSRLNIPNDVPNATWARDKRKGIAVVSRCYKGSAALALDILRPGDQADEIVQRSFVLGTWKSTTTRSYGWF